MNNLDIIVCYGHEKKIPFNPILWGTNVQEMSKTLRNRENIQRLEMIDLNWKSFKFDRYEKKIRTLHNAKNKVSDNHTRARPIKYVVLPDLLDIDKYDKTINFGQNLFDDGIMEIGLLPVKINIELDDLPDWIRPSIPIPSGYTNKKDEKINLSSFYNYNSGVHTLGGGNFKGILNFVSMINPKIKIKSMDINSIFLSAYKGSVLSRNGYKWIHYDDIGFDLAIHRTLVNLKFIHKQLNSDKKLTPIKLLNKLGVKDVQLSLNHFL